MFNKQNKISQKGNKNRNQSKIDGAIVKIKR